MANHTQQRCIPTCAFLAVLVLVAALSAADKPKKAPAPVDEFVVGRFTLLDSDPQGFYDIFVVRAAGGLA